MEQAIHNEDGKMIGVVTRPEGGRNFFAHSIHVVSGRGRKFPSKWEAANWLHAVHDNARDVS